MANPEHVALLKQGVDVWNEWRADNSSTRPDLGGVDHRGAILRTANLSGAILSGAILSKANLTGANLSGADLSRAYLIAADLSEVDLSGANLSSAILIGADLSGANLVRANLSGAYLMEAYLMGADLMGAVVAQANLGHTVIGNIDLSKVNGLEAVYHYYPSSVGIDTIYKSGGNIPDVFLRGTGIPDNFITYVHSLVGQPIRYYSCFISYTQADDVFAERLYNDLQGAGVRCWRWKEDAPWGKTLIRSIDEAVGAYDKLIVICSENSLNAQPVIREIERALQKEDAIAKEGKEPEVLFPIRVDDYIFDTWRHYRKPDVTLKNIGDFRKWQDPQQYKKAFDRLVRDLKA